MTTITLAANATSYSDTGLSASTIYYYRAKATSANWGDSAYSSTAIATTQTPADTTAPSTSMTTPSAGSTVSNTVTVSATASDNVGVSSGAFYCDVYGFWSATIWKFVRRENPGIKQVEVSVVKKELQVVKQRVRTRRRTKNITNELKRKETIWNS